MEGTTYRILDDILKYVAIEMDNAKIRREGFPYSLDRGYIVLGMELAEPIIITLGAIMEHLVELYGEGSKDMVKRCVAIHTDYLSAKGYLDKWFSKNKDGEIQHPDNPRFNLTLEGFIKVTDGGFVHAAAESKRFERLEIQVSEAQKKSLYLNAGLAVFGFFALFFSACTYYFEYMKMTHKNAYFPNWWDFRCIGFLLGASFLTIVFLALALVSKALKGRTPKKNDQYVQ